MIFRFPYVTQSRLKRNILFIDTLFFLSNLYIKYPIFGDIR